MKPTAFRHELLEEILSQPTAPFRERHVIDCVSKVLERARVPFFSDPVGNLVIGAGSEREYRKRLRQSSPEPVRIFVAHMDHPGFHGLEWGTGKGNGSWKA